MINRGRWFYHLQINTLQISWQRFMDEDRTFYSVIEKDISEYDKEYLEFRDE